MKTEKHTHKHKKRSQAPAVFNPKKNIWYRVVVQYTLVPLALIAAIATLTYISYTRVDPSESVLSVTTEQTIK